jgi:hypothetical protein
MKKVLLMVAVAVFASQGLQAKMRAEAERAENSTMIKVTNSTATPYLFQACEAGYKKNCDIQRRVVPGKATVLSVPDRMSKGEVK